MLLCVVVPGYARDSTDASLLWDDILDRLDVLSPLVASSTPGIAYVDMRGIAGTPQQWMQCARDVLDAFELPLRVACAQNPFVARAASAVADGAICARGEEAALLAPLPLDLLEVDPRTQERLRLLGVHTLGELARLPHGPFVRRFGPQSAAWHERARGIDRTPFLPRGHALAIEAASFGEGGIEAVAHLAFALRVLLDRVCTDLERVGQRCGVLRVEFELENGDAIERDVGLARPTADAHAMLDVLRANLESATFDAPIVGVRVRALQLEENGDAMGLFCGGEPDPQAVAVTLARLEAALGAQARRARPVPAYALEGQFAYDPFVMPAFSALPGRPPAEALPEHLTPQLRLLQVREIVVRVRAGVPARVDGREVRRVAGPWRIDDNWFGERLTRDEYDVLLDDEKLYRIYRQGTCWYLRGSYD